MLQNCLEEIKNLMTTGKSPVAIYGAGEYGRRVKSCLDDCGIEVFCYIVSKRLAEEKECDGVPLFGLDEIEWDFFETVLLIVAVERKKHDEIKKAITERFGDGQFKNTLFWGKEEVGKLNRECHPLDTKLFLQQIEPVSRLYGNDRGTPIDRYYIENFLKKKSEDIYSPGLKLLEVGEDTYSKRFFPRCLYDVLDYSAGMDLTKEETIPEEKYDVFIATQVFHQIYQISDAIAGAKRLLKKNGIMLATVCGTIVKPARNDEYEHYWGFTIPSITNLMKEVFQNEIEIQAYGNAAVATAFIQGIATEELSLSVLEKYDPDYPICISIFARKA